MPARRSMTTKTSALSTGAVTVGHRDEKGDSELQLLVTRIYRLRFNARPKQSEKKVVLSVGFYFEISMIMEIRRQSNV